MVYKVGLKKKMKGMNHSFFFCLQPLNSFKLRPIRKNLERVSRPRFPTIRNAQPPRKGGIGPVEPSELEKY